MFESIGKSIDKVIGKVAKWNRRRIWYKVYAYLFITNKIIRGYFKDYEHFERFIKIVSSNNQITQWQYHRLRSKYLKFH